MLTTILPFVISLLRSTNLQMHCKIFMEESVDLKPYGYRWYLGVGSRK